MADLILGTIIGGLVGLISSIVGFLIQGYYSNKNTLVQITAQKEEQAEKFKFEKKRQEINRLIQVRETWTKSLYTSLITYAENIDKTSLEINILRVNFPDGQAAQSVLSSGLEFDRLFTDLTTAVKELDNASDNLGKEMAPISDSILKNLISNLISEELQLSLIVYKPLNREEYEDSDKIVGIIKDELASAFKKLEDLSCGIED